VSAAGELLRAEGLSKAYSLARGAGGIPSATRSAVSDVSFSLADGETLALVGESGSGKTTTARLLLRLEEPDAGRIVFAGDDWLALSGEALRRRRRQMQVVFQDPQTSLNPRMTVGDQIAEPLKVQELVARRDLRREVARRLSQVGLDASAATLFPREFSGGQRQRVAIARALAAGPRLLICDEPTSALDVSVAGQIVNVLLELREAEGLAMIFISHDLGLVRAISGSIAVMYRGRIVEQGPAGEVTARPLHPYTAALLSAVLSADPARSRRRIVLPPDEERTAAPRGCAFAPRCPIARARCREETPALGGGAHRAACFFPGELETAGDW
jgi:oligopeptide/dipeptide ABC transporter ATP-binding protein